MQLVEIRRRVLAACDWILYIVAIDRVQRKVQNSKILDVLKKQNQMRCFSRWKISWFPVRF